MKVLFDTNILLDVMLNRKPHADAAAELFMHVEQGELTGCNCATSVTTFHCLAQKTCGKKQATQQLGELLKFFEIAPVTQSVLQEAYAHEGGRF